MTDPSEARAPPRVFATLDALRGCAALAIVVLHTRALFGWQAHIVAYLAVDFFFCLSGFVLCHAYRDRLSHNLTTRAFLRLRLIRLYPLYVLSLLFATVVAAIDVAKGSTTIGAIAAIALREVVLMPSAAHGVRSDAFVLNLAAWSLAFEIAINIVLALAWRALTIRHLQLVCAVTGVLMIAVAAINHNVSVGWNLLTLPAGAIRVTFSFFLGVLLYETSRPSLGRPVAVPANLAGMALVVGLAALLLSSPSGLVHGLVDMGAIAVAFPAMIYIGARLQPSGVWREVALRLGAASYALYILHVPLRNLLANALEACPIAASPWLGVPVLAVMLLLAIVLDTLYDRPVRRWLANATAPSCLSFYALKREVGNVFTFGLPILLRHWTTRDALGAVRVRTRIGQWRLRPHDSDLDVLRQIFRRRDYDLSRYAQSGRIDVRYRALLAQGRVPVVIDAGANIGAASVWYATQFPAADIIAIEPDPANASLCRTNTAARPTVTVLQAALGASPGTVSLASEAGAGWAVRTRLDPAGTTPLVTINQLLEDRGPAAALLLVKIDIEGFERELFAAGTEWIAQAFAIVVELHDYQLPGQYSSRTLQRALFDQGFELLISGENLVFVR